MQIRFFPKARLCRQRIFKCCSCPLRCDCRQRVLCKEKPPSRIAEELPGTGGLLLCSFLKFRRLAPHDFFTKVPHLHLRTSSYLRTRPSVSTASRWTAKFGSSFCRASLTEGRADSPFSLVKTPISVEPEPLMNSPREPCCCNSSKIYRASFIRGSL